MITAGVASANALRIRLIEPAAPSLHMWSYSHYPRLGLPVIGAALKAAGHDVRVYCAQLGHIDRHDLLTSDLVGLSTTTSTAPAAYALADNLRRRGIPTVVGGSHVTFLADEALEHADYVCRGEGGEEVMLEIIEALAGRRELDSIRGLSFTRDGRHIHNEPRERCTSLDTVPVPDLSLMAGCAKLKTTPVMTSWGCPFACTFCSVTAMFGRRVRVRSVDHVIAELKAKRPRRLSFYDDNFAADKPWLKTLLQAMIENGVAVPWLAQVRTDVARDAELLDLMQRSGCECLALGLESIDQATLDAFKKSQTVDDIVSAVQTLHDHGIKVHGMFVIGADNDTADTVRKTVDFAIRHRIDTLMLNVLTPAPGTLQFEEMDAAGRIFTKDWALYDGQHVVFTPKGMEPAQLQREVQRGYRRFYSSRRWLAYLARLQLSSLWVHSWCWWFARSWHLDARNRAHMRRLVSGVGPAIERASGRDAEVVA